MSSKPGRPQTVGTGCWDHVAIDELAFVFGMAIDEAPRPEHFYLGVVTPAFTEGAQGQTIKTIVMTRSISQGLMNMQLQRERILELGKVSTIIFSSEAAESDTMHKVVRQLDQQRDINPNVWLVVAEEMDARDALYLEPPEEERIAIYLDDLLSVGFSTGQIPELTLSQFWARYHAWGISPIIPTVKKTESDSLMLSGLAIVNNEGKVKGYFNDGDTVMYMLLTGEKARGRFFTEVNYQGQKDRWVTSFVKKLNRKVDTEIIDHKPELNILIDLELEIINIDITVDNLLSDQIFDELEKAMARDLHGNMLKVIDVARNSGADPFGFGQYVRAQNYQWTKNKNWDDEFPNSKFNIEVKVSIKRIGTLLNPNY